MPSGSSDGPIGVPELDTVADAVAAIDIPAIVAKIKYAELECTAAQGLGGPPKCAAGQAPGTKVQVLPFSTCEQEYLRSSNVAAVLEQQLKAPTLHSAFDLKDHGTAELPIGTRGIVFELETGALMVGVDDDGKIVSLSRGCGLSAEELYEHTHGDEVHHEPEHD